MGGLCLSPDAHSYSQTVINAIVSQNRLLFSFALTREINFQHEFLVFCIIKKDMNGKMVTLSANYLAKSVMATTACYMKLSTQ